jgi:hypothetical protein
VLHEETSNVEDSEGVFQASRVHGWEDHVGDVVLSNVAKSLNEWGVQEEAVLFVKGNISVDHVADDQRT